MRKKNIHIFVRFSRPAVFLLTFCWFLFGGSQEGSFPLHVPIAEAGAPTYFGSSSNPGDNGTGADASTLAVTPPASMVAGDLVVFIGIVQDASAGNVTISATGGQTWISATETNSNDMEGVVFWAQYNGTWGANPSLAFASIAGTVPVSAIMHVFRPDTVGTWALDTDLYGGSEAAASPTDMPAITPHNRDTVTLATWAIPNISTWGTLSGTGWNAITPAQYRNSSGSDLSATFAYQLQSTPTSTNTVSQVPSTPASGIAFIFAWSNRLSPTTVLNTPTDAGTVSTTTPTLNFAGTDGNADTLEYNVQVDTVNTFDSVAAEGTNTYYFDGHTSISDPNSNWPNDADAFDGNTATGSYQSASSTTSSNYLQGDGTNAPSSGRSITQVRARAYISTSGNNLNAAIYTSGLGELLGTVTKSGIGTGYTSYAVLTTPSGGWSWGVLQSLSTKLYGTDTGDPVRVVEIEVTSTASPLISAFSTDTTATYYFDASVAGPTDVGGVCTNEANAVDGNTATVATFAGDSGSKSGQYLEIKGTNSPTSGGDITLVRTRIHNGTSFGSYVSLATPSGGWTWTKVSQLETRRWYNMTPNVGAYETYIGGDSGGTALSSLADFASSISKIEVEVAYSTVGFTAGHPFASATAVDYTLQSSLTTGLTYYWRVASIDPNGQGTWSATQSFTVTASAPSRVIRLSGKVKFIGKVKIF